MNTELHLKPHLWICEKANQSVADPEKAVITLCGMKSKQST